MGANGVGKTSLLEAIYFLATTKSFRTARLADCRRWGQPSFWVRGVVAGERPTALSAAWKEGGASRSANGKNVALGPYLAHLRAISWSARDNRFLDGEQSARRRFMDQGIVGLNTLAVETLGQYRRVLAAKKTLLARSPGERLEPWNRLLAEAGHQLIRLRRAYIEELQGSFGEIGSQLDVALPGITLRYRPSPRDGDSVDEFETRLNQAEERERQTQRCQLGPHRDRLEIRWGEADIGRAASIGERKLFGLILTAARRQVLAAAGAEPIVLLDDLDAGLDRARLERLWQPFRGLPQVLVTSADPGLAEVLSEARGWHFEAGGVLTG